MRASSTKNEDKYDQIDIQLSPDEKQDSVTRSQQTNSSGNIQTVNIQTAHTAK